MSTWTHVHGVIRIDGMEALGIPLPDLGKMSLWEDDHEAELIPCGSEGSLRYTVWENPDSSALARWTVTIFGDLRDYDDEQEIIDYFKNITDGAKMVRGGVFELEVEGRESRSFRFNSDSRQWLETI